MCLHAFHCHDPYYTPAAPTPTGITRPKNCPPIPEDLKSEATDAFRNNMLAWQNYARANPKCFWTDPGVQENAKYVF